MIWILKFRDIILKSRFWSYLRWSRLKNFDKSS